MANWIQRFLAAITTHKGDASAHHDKTPRTAVLTVAASDSSAKSKAGADYVCSGVNDEVEIQAAITALGAAGGTIVCLEGTYNIVNDIDITHQSIGRILLFAYGAKFNHTGAGYCLKVLSNITPGNVPYRISYLHGLYIVGSGAGAGGIQVNSGVYHTIEDFWVEGYSAGKGIDVFADAEQCEKTKIHKGAINNCLYGLHTRGTHPHDESSYRDVQIASNVANAILFHIEKSGFSVLLDNLSAHCYADNQIGYNLAFGATGGSIVNSIKAERHAGAGQTAIKLVSSTNSIIFINYAIVGAFATGIDNAANIPYTHIAGNRTIELHGDNPRVSLNALVNLPAYLWRYLGTVKWDVRCSDPAVTAPLDFNNTDGNAAIRLEQDARFGDGETAMMIRRRVGAAYTLQIVSMGVADSGGAGFKGLRVPN